MKLKIVILVTLGLAMRLQATLFKNELNAPMKLMALPGYPKRAEQQKIDVNPQQSYTIHNVDKYERIQVHSSAMPVDVLLGQDKLAWLSGHPDAMVIIEPVPAAGVAPRAGLVWAGADREGHRIIIVSTVLEEPVAAGDEKKVQAAQEPTAPKPALEALPAQVDDLALLHSSLLALQSAAGESKKS